MSNTFKQIPDGAKIAVSESTRIQEEKTRAAHELASQLVAHYMSRKGTSLCISLSYQFYPVTDLAQKYAAHKDVCKAACQILSEHNWSAKFENGYYGSCTLSPVVSS